MLSSKLVQKKLSESAQQVAGWAPSNKI